MEDPDAGLPGLKAFERLTQEGVPPPQNAPVKPGEPNPAHAHIKREAFVRNHATCSTCSKTWHEQWSPLVLCDFCPRAYHVMCLDLDWPDLPEGEWACPRCIHARQGKGGLYAARTEAER
jgi:hypothetical protein